jgi:SAM-dependent methyltransferase
MTIQRIRRAALLLLPAPLLRPVLLLLPTLLATGAFAGEAAVARFDSELKKQDSIYQSRGEQVPEGYVTDRSLPSYLHTLSPAFARALANLAPKDRWLDIGAGRGQAVLDYYGPRYDLMREQTRDLMQVRARERSGGKAQAVAMSIEDRRSPLWALEAAKLGANQIQYLSGKRLREYSLHELGQFRIITDVAGGFSYTSDLSLFMRKVLEFLEPGGEFFTLLVDVRNADSVSRPYFAASSYLTEINNADGSAASACAWLKSIACVEVSCEARAQWQPPVEVFHIRKTCAATTVPALLPVHFEAGTPPARRFRLAN